MMATSIRSRDASASAAIPPGLGNCMLVAFLALDKVSSTSHRRQGLVKVS